MDISIERGVDGYAIPLKWSKNLRWLLLLAPWLLFNPAFSQAIVDIDSPTTGQNLSGGVTAYGWAISSTSIVTSVTYSVDYHAPHQATYGSSRPDVCAVYGNLPGCPYVGYGFTLNSYAIDDGPHTLIITATTADGKVSTETRQFTSSNGNTPSMYALNYGCGRCMTAQDVSYGIGTGAKWSYVGAGWGGGLESNPPTAGYPKAPDTPFYGPYSKLWHNYDIAGLDTTVQMLAKAGLPIAMQIGSPPGWAGTGNNTCEPGTGASNCGVIYNSQKASLKNNIADVAYFLAQRYPQVHTWILGEEPNDGGYFSPQPPLTNGSIAEEFMQLEAIPAAAGIKAVNPNAVIGGPEINITCEGGGRAGNDCSTTDPVWNYTYDWQLGWAQYLVDYYPTFFDKFTFHDYDTNPQDPRTAVGTLYSYMTTSNHIMSIWETEMNDWGNPSQSSMANIACNTYKNATWERAFYYALQAPAYGLISSNAAGGYPIQPLYSDFQKIVATSPKSSLNCNF